MYLCSRLWTWRPSAFPISVSTLIAAIGMIDVPRIAVIAAGHAWDVAPNTRKNHRFVTHGAHTSLIRKAAFVFIRYFLHDRHVITNPGIYGFTSASPVHAAEVKGWMRWFLLVIIPHRRTASAAPTTATNMGR